MTERILPLTTASQEADQSFDLREALSFIWRQWKFVLAVTALICAIGAVLLFQQTPLYTANVQILVNQLEQNPPGGDSALPQIIYNADMINSQMAIIRSSAFLRRVVERDHLARDPAVAVRAAEVSSSLWSGIESLFSSLLPGGVSLAASPRLDDNAVPVDSVTAAGGDAIPANELASVRALSTDLRVSRGENDGYVITISYTSPDAARSARIANDIADAYLVDKLDARLEEAKRASSWLSDRLVTLQQQAQESEEVVANFRADHGLTQSGNGVTLTQQQLANLNADLIAARADLAQKKAQVDLLSSIAAKGGSLQDMPAITNAGALPTLRAQESALTAQEAQLLTRYDKSYPLVVNLEAQLRDVQRSVAAETERLAASIRNDYALAQAKDASLEASLRQATGQTNLDDATAVKLHELERTAEVNKTLFEDFLKQAKISQADATFEPVDARIIAPAVVPTTASSPQKTRFMAFTLFFGLLTGIGGAFGKEKLRSGFTTPKEVEDQLGLPLLASVSRLMPRDLKSDSGALLIHELPVTKPLGRYSEAIRSLRSGIHMTDVDQPPKVIQVTSAAPSEGKTTIAMSLAASGASAKLNVLFIDADLRHPSATHVFGLQKARGLVDLLLGEVAVNDVVSFNESGGYWVLSAGNKTQNPSDLLGSEKMKTLIAGFKQSYDLIIVDTPPSGPVIDPVVVAQLCDKIVYVIRWGATARELVKQSVDQLSGHRKIAGAVFNQVNEREAQKYGRYAYSYYYGTRYYNKYYSDGV